MIQLFEITCLCGREMALGLECGVYWGRCECGRIWRLEEVSGEEFQEEEAEAEGKGLP